MPRPTQLQYTAPVWSAGHAAFAWVLAPCNETTRRAYHEERAGNVIRRVALGSLRAKTVERISEIV